MRRTNVYLTDTDLTDTDVDAALGQVVADLSERARAISRDDVDLHIA